MLMHKLAAQLGAKTTRMNRRFFLQASGGVTTGLLLGFGATAGAGKALAATRDGTFSPFVSISPDGLVTVLSKHLDKGQGTLTGLAVLVAEKLDADWGQMRGAHAPAETETYKNLAFGVPSNLLTKSMTEAR